METDTYDLAWISTINLPKEPYSDRINRRQWDISKANIAILHSEGYTKPDILDMLQADSFMPSYKQLRSQMDRWGLNRSNRGKTGQGVGLTTAEDTEGSDSEPESSTEEREISSETISLKTTSSENFLTENPAVFGWSSFAAHSIPSCNQSASSALVDDAQSDGESIISRQTFATHPSDSSSFREWRQDARRLDDIRKAEAFAHWQAQADAGLLTESQRFRVYKAVRIRAPKYECHFCKQVINKPRSFERTCRRCRHKRCTACLDWPKPQKLPGKIGSETCEINHS